jgi:glutathione S-transferase
MPTSGTPIVEGRYRLVGSTASPYALKMRAILRYRRIPFDWVIMTRELRAETAHLKPNLIPALRYPDGTWRGETTALAHDLERRHLGRSIIPEDPALAFVCDLLEDMGDEWAVKPLFLYRWWDPEDQDYVSRWAGEEWSVFEEEQGSEAEREAMRRRQISRMPILGATPENKPLLEESYRRMLAAIEPHVGLNRFFFGTRPSLADFAWYGQLNEMATDPTPMRIMRALAPKTDIWARRADDTSGVEGEWWPFERVMSGAARDLLALAGELYLPFLTANEQAWAKGLDKLEMRVWSLDYTLAPFKYQVKCLTWLRDRFAALDPEDRARLELVLRETGCWPHLTIAPAP